MRIAIIGAGAMGSLFGVRLALAGNEVWLLAKSDCARSINQTGLTLISGDREITAHLKAAAEADAIGQVELAIFCVKSGDTALAAEAATPLIGQDTAVLTLQNGYGNAEELANRFGPARVLSGTTAQGATLLEPGKVRHGGNGETHIGEYCGSVTDRLQRIADLFTMAGLPTTAETDMVPLLWGKLIINVGINALTGITGVQNGRLLDYPQTRKILETAVQEAVAVAKAHGIKLPFDDPVGKVLSVAGATAQNRSSMLQDLDKVRRTEIDAINGAIVRQGNKLGIPTPVNEILYLLIKALEQIKKDDS